MTNIRNKMNYQLISTSLGLLALLLIAATSSNAQGGGSSGGGVIVRSLPDHLMPLHHQTQQMLFREARIDEVIDLLLANPEYVNHPVSRGKFQLALCYALQGRWQEAAQVFQGPGMAPINFAPMLYAFSGQIELARKEFEVRFNPDSNPEDPLSPYLAQGDSVRALQANTAYVYAMSSEPGSHPWLSRHFLRLAYSLAPEAPLIALRYVDEAEPDVRKGLAILATLEFPTNRRLRTNLASVKGNFQRWLRDAERGERSFILEARTKAP